MQITRSLRGHWRLLSLVAASSIVVLAGCNRGEGAPASQQSGSGGGQRAGGPNGGAGGGGGGPRGSGGPGGFGARPTGPTAVEVLPVRRGSVSREATVAGV